MSPATEPKRATRPTVARLREVEAERDRAYSVATAHQLATTSLTRERDEAKAQADEARNATDNEARAIVAIARSLESVGSDVWGDEEWSRDERDRKMRRVLRAAADRFDLDVKVKRRGD